MAIAHIKHIMRKNKINSTSVIQEITWKELNKANRTLSVPFNLLLANSSDPLSCHEVARIMPGKRIVAFAMWGEKPVVAKIFYDRATAAKKAKADAEGIQALIDRGIPTPKILYQGTAQKKRIHVILYDRIFNAVDLDTLWQNKIDIPSTENMMRAVTLELATQHVLGVMQNDLHFKNFLMTGKTIYTLDGGDIEKFDTPLPKKETIDNLGLFFSQLGVGTEALQQKLFKIYAKSRGWIVKQQEALKLENAITTWTQKRWVSYRDKIMRSCTAFAELKNHNAKIIYDRSYESEELLSLLKNPESAFSAQTTKVLKAGRSSTVIKIKIDGRSYVLKRYNLKSLGHRLRRCLRETRAAHAWRLSQYLRWIGIPTAKPVAFIENQFLGLRGKSYFLMEYVKGQDATQFLTEHNNNPEQITRVAERIVTLFTHLAKLRLTHGDLKTTNILIEHNRPVLIDLDGMQTHRTQRSFNKTFNKELARFMQNWQSHPTIAKLFQSLIQSHLRSTNN